MSQTDWSQDKTISPARPINIVYTIKNANDQYERRVARLMSTQWSENYTYFEQIFYRKERWNEGGSTYVTYGDEWVTSWKSTTTRDTIASVNGSLVKWCLENGHGLPSGDVFKYSYTTYRYVVFEGEGPRLRFERTIEYIDFMELLGSLNISDYGPIGGETFAAGEALESQITEVEYEWFYSDGREYTKTSTSRWIAFGLTQEGQQAAAEMFRQEDGTGNASWEVIDSALQLKYDGTEVRSSIGRVQLPSRPSDQDIAQDDILDDTGDIVDGEAGSAEVYGSWGAGDAGDASEGFDFGTSGIDWQDYNGTNPDTGEPYWASFIDGDWTDYTGDSNDDGVPDWVDELPTPGGGGSGGGSGGTSSVAQYDMPFPPDDYYGPNGQLIAGNAAQAAKKYGQTMNALKAANSFGINVTTAVQKVGTQALSPLYLNAGGIRVQTRMNGTAWAFGNMGIVVSSDLLLAGVVARTA
jgi:hypothetical protein